MTLYALGTAGMRSRDRKFARASVRSREGVLALATLLAVVLPSARVRAQDSTAFPHARHSSIPCMTCHVTTATGARLKIAAPDGCRSCHHGTAQKATCSACHGKTLATTRSVSVDFTAPKRLVPVARQVGFEHQRHGAVGCDRCHANDLVRAPRVTCASCHADHHAPERDCAACHPTARIGHDRAVHDGCTACHNAVATPAMRGSRTLCLSCHEAQRNHNPGGDCAACHAIPSHVPRGLLTRTR